VKDYRYTFPPSIDRSVALRIARDLARLPTKRHILFDFRDLGYVCPFSLIFVATGLEDAVARVPERRSTVIGHKKKFYLSHMGFFGAFGVDHGNAPGEARGSSRYLPITDIDCQELYRVAAQSGAALGAVVEERAHRIASVLAQAVEGDFYDALAYATREILRNALEHSQTQTLRYCAQYWPNLDRVEVAILDRGRGIRASLARNPFIECRTDRQAINYALMPGVSGTAFKGSRINRADVWRNSGYGLYLTSRICRLDGEFFLGSYEAAMSLTAKGKTYHDFDFSGTCVRMVIKPSQSANLSSRLKQFSIEGKELAEKIRGTVLKPSTASQMLTVDFGKSQQ
jgi:hypothetical protein